MRCCISDLFMSDPCMDTLTHHLMLLPRRTCMWLQPGPCRAMPADTADASACTACRAPPLNQGCAPAAGASLTCRCAAACSVNGAPLQVMPESCELRKACSLRLLIRVWVPECLVTADTVDDGDSRSGAAQHINIMLFREPSSYPATCNTCDCRVSASRERTSHHGTRGAPQAWRSGSWRTRTTMSAASSTALVAQLSSLPMLGRPSARHSSSASAGVAGRRPTRTRRTTARMRGTEPPPSAEGGRLLWPAACSGPSHIITITPMRICDRADACAAEHGDGACSTKCRKHAPVHSQTAECEHDKEGQVCPCGCAHWGPQRLLASRMLARAQT